MTTRLIADSEHMDHVTILLARVCAARLDTTIKAEDFVRMVARLVDVAVAEAIEDHEARPPVVPTSKLRCMYCMQTVERWPHECGRMRELGLLPPKANGTDTLLDKLGVIDDERSTGAAAIAQRAEQPPATATATEPPAAPSTSTLPAAERFPAASSQEGAASATGGAASTGRRVLTAADRAAIKADYLAALGTRKRVPRGALDALAEKHGWSKLTIKDIVKAIRDGSIAEPASSQQPPSSLSESAADGAGTSPAGVSAGEEASQPKTRQRFSPEEVETLGKAYERALRENGGAIPRGWIGKQAEAMGRPYDAIFKRVTAMKGDPPPAMPPPKRDPARAQAERFKVRHIEGTRY